MPLIAIPNVSEGRDGNRIRELVGAVQDRGSRVLDVHVDEIHHRSVFTVTGSRAHLVAGMTELARGLLYVDLRAHRGAHPRLGGLDVCPIVPHETAMTEAVATAHETGRSINETTGLPVYFYGEASARPETKELPALRRGGLEDLMRRAAHALPPDLGPRSIDPRHGVVCVGVRRELVAFNVWLRTDRTIAARIAAEVRTTGGGPPGVRALGVGIDAELSQVSMNLIEPAITGIDEAFRQVARRARSLGVEVTATEIVGLVPERFLPDPDAKAARLLLEPGRSLESPL